MVTLFYLAGILAIIATLFAITRRHAVHALLYLIVSLLAIAIDFYTLGAPFVAALEVMIYAGAIMVLFVFVVMMLNVAEHAMEVERYSLHPKNWFGPALLALVLLAELVYSSLTSINTPAPVGVVGPKQVGTSLFGTFWIGVELASLLLMAGLIGAYHLGRQVMEKEGTKHAADTTAARLDISRDLIHAGAGRTDHAA
ncbi:MAG TPA: NADH-quinone oxidoreductase subunit J [Alloacidobacterium sp.]|jgi:NADH-quinone oxidoreductase subunit J|nr:NADH-quinone oxidoreductase subunit J [Alloacidobacterium sp.]